MAEQGYITLSRKFFEHPFWTKDRQYSEAEAWLYLVKEARFEVSEASRLIGGKIVRWGRGQLPASLRYLADKWQWDKNKVDRYLKMLSNEGMIKTGTAAGTAQTVITLCNYDSYNERKKKTGQDWDTNGTQTGQGRDNTNKGNNGNNGKEEGDAAFAATPQPINPSFKKWTKEQFVTEIKEHEEKYDRDLRNAFYRHWSEVDDKGKMRFQHEKTWETAKRLATWHGREGKKFKQ